MRRVCIVGPLEVEMAGILNALAEYNRDGWYLHTGQRCAGSDLIPLILKCPKNMGETKFIAHLLEPDLRLSSKDNDEYDDNDALKESDFILYALDLSQAVSADPKRSKKYIIESIKIINAMQNITPNVAIIIPSFERYSDYVQSQPAIFGFGRSLKDRKLRKFLRKEIPSIFDQTQNHGIPIFELGSNSEQHMLPWRQDGEYSQIKPSEPSREYLGPLLDWIEKRDGSNRSFVMKILRNNRQ